MKRFLALLVGLLVCGAAHAQVLTAMVVASCGTPPQTYNSGLTYPITMDVTGKLCNGASVFGAVTTNLTQLAGATLGAPSNYGTSPGAVAPASAHAPAGCAGHVTPPAPARSSCRCRRRARGRHLIRELPERGRTSRTSSAESSPSFGIHDGAFASSDM